MVNYTWRTNHNSAMLHPVGAEVPIVGLLRAWREYQTAHAKRYETGIGNDYVLGVEWENIGRAIIRLLNGETGRLDCGTLDGDIRRILADEGFCNDN